MTHSEKRVEWKARFDAWKASDLSAAAWCRGQGIKPSQMYYRIRNFEDDQPSDLVHETQWMTVDMEEPLNFRSNDSVLIHFDSMTIEVRQGTDMALLSDVVDVLNRC